MPGAVDRSTPRYRPTWRAEHRRRLRARHRRMLARLSCWSAISRSAWSLVVVEHYLAVDARASSITAATTPVRSLPPWQGTRRARGSVGDAAGSCRLGCAVLDCRHTCQQHPLPVGVVMPAGGAPTSAGRPTIGTCRSTTGESVRSTCPRRSYTVRTPRLRNVTKSASVSLCSGRRGTPCPSAVPPSVIG